MSTALVMDFYSNVLKQGLKEANEAAAGAGGCGYLINRQGIDQPVSLRSGRGSEGAKHMGGFHRK